MKILNLQLLGLLLTGIVAAQTPSSYPEAPGVTVVKNSWYVEARDRKLEEDPLGPTNEQAEKDRYRKYEDEIMAGGSPPVPVPRPQVWRNPTKSRPLVVYSFEATIRNSGTKKIHRLVWEYVFLNPATRREVGYRPFMSNVNISPGKSTKMIGYFVRDQINATDAKELVRAAKQSKGKYIEQIAIRRVEYADGTLWQRPSK